MAQDHSDTTGQQPNHGYDYQQAWYPQPEAANDPWGGAGYTTPYGTTDAQAWHQQPAEQQWNNGYYPTDAYGYQNPPPPAGWGNPHAQPTEQQYYAPPGTEQHYGYVPYEAAPEQPVEPPMTVESFETAEQLAEDAAVAEETGRPSKAALGSLVDRAKAAADAVISADHAPSRRTLAIRVGAGAAALIVLIVAAVLATGDDKPATASGTDSAQAPQNISVAHDKAWTAQPASAPAAGTDDTLVGSWLLANAVVRADASGVQAYGLADGKPAWSVAPPASGAVPCGLSPSVNSAGLGAALFRTSSDPKSPCTQLTVVDTKSGKTAWTKSLSDNAKPGYAAQVAVTDDKVIAVGDGKVAAWSSADGKDAWQYGGPGQFCTLSGNAAGATVLLHSNCADSAPADQALALNVADGKVKWWAGINNQPKTITVLSAEPSVVMTTGANPADDRVFAWGAGGGTAVEIPLTSDAGRIDATHGSFDAVPGVFFHDHTMLTTVTPADGSGPAVTAIDLTTGKPAWKTPIGEKGKARPAGLDASGLLLAVDERLDKPAHISRFALAGGQETEGGAFPKGTGSLLSSGRVLIGAGKVIAVPEHSSNYGTATAFQNKG